LTSPGAPELKGAGAGRGSGFDGSPCVRPDNYSKTHQNGSAVKRRRFDVFTLRLVAAYIWRFLFSGQHLGAGKEVLETFEESIMTLE